MKNKNTFAAIAAIAIAAGGNGVYRLGVHQGMQTMPAGGDAPPVAAGNGRQPLYWHDPMVPGQKFDKPGKSPFMDMQLVPVYAGADSDDGSVIVSPRVQQNLGIRTAIVTAGRLPSGVVTVGSVAYNDRDVALVQARSNGFIERLYVRAALDTVKQGQPLAELYVPDWIAAQEEFLAARRMQGGDTASLVDGARQRMRLAGMTDGQIRLVESSGKVHPRITISAPVSGVVAELGAREGMTVASGAQLFRLNGLSTVWVNADVPENVAAKVHPGDAVEARSPALPGSVFKGKVGAVLPEVSAATRTLKARIELANTGGQLVPGMFATITFTSSRDTDVLLVPSEAVIQTGTRSVVVLAQDGGKFQPIDVEVGGEGNGLTEIRKGLTAGQKIVLSGQFLLDSEASLKGTTTRMGDAQSSGSPQDAPLHHGQGKVERIDKDEVTISHGPIATLQWRAMTMGFKTPPAGLPRNVDVGDRVAFDIKPRQDGTFEIVAISPVADAPVVNDKAMGGMKMPAVPTGAKK
ncbi:efflux RND transporter periplasmic adaptor subunit [Duganella violaceipulchra]|uniref:Cu(I)/Ag(I) efflux system membrane fusion protein n=1 Tax=Duganella violaceipulchra TaxID=2849652 RepID=A0AA41HFW4_9BURK|nr:efflux RND transporter periplasmic adaptor subunit [Duganella violaceicalia]MBV6323749.1 efflux RND transporter periplasmic adaptor subunit [Duganella violaceicalia]MCP2007438.1 Cu(I)/Ag(I) efflux system membrane fusion protein [Duganella violaceicalia]